VPWTPVEAMDTMKVLSVTLLPGAVMWTAAFLIGIVSRVGADVHGNTARVAVATVACLLGLVALAAFAVAASLFFFMRPRRYLPPRYRRS
jgi:purine-cytosine permease-like protein